MGKRERGEQNKRQEMIHDEMVNREKVSLFSDIWKESTVAEL